jgi:hypothetical protein
MVLALGLAAQAWAQYPPVTGNVVLAAGDATPDLGEEVTLTAAVLDENAEPLAGVECSFSIASQPGDDASVDAGPFTTDANGNVSTTLDTGSTAGAIVVEASCGELSAQVSVVAGEAEPPASQPGAEPPASLPDTGSGAASSSAGWAIWAIAAAGVVAGLSGLAIARRWVRR